MQVPEGAAVPELVKLKMETEAKLAEAALVDKKASLQIDQVVVRVYNLTVICGYVDFWVGRHS